MPTSATYHVTCKSVWGAPLLSGRGEFEAYLTDLERLSREHQVAVLAFCAIASQTHLCLKTCPDGGSTSDLQQALLERLRQRHEALGGSRTHLYSSCSTEPVALEDLPAVVDRLHHLPVAYGFADTPADWPYSSWDAYEGRRFSWVQTEEVLALRLAAPSARRARIEESDDDPRLRVQAALALLDAQRQSRALLVNRLHAEGHSLEAISAVLRTRRIDPLVSEDEATYLPLRP